MRSFFLKKTALVLYKGTAIVTGNIKGEILRRKEEYDMGKIADRLGMAGDGEKTQQLPHFQ